MKNARFTEILTGTEVFVDTFFVWEPYPKISTVRFPSGITYALPDTELQKYFVVVSPQEVFLEGFGGIDERPLPEQRKIACVREEPEPDAMQLSVSDVEVKP